MDVPKDTSTDERKDSTVEVDATDEAADLPVAGLLRGVCPPNTTYPALTAADLVRPQTLATSVQINGQAEDFSFLEGPVWLSESNQLLWSDFNNSSPLAQDNGGPPTRILSLVPGQEITVFSEAGVLRTNGLAVDPQGQLVVADHGRRAITRVDPATLAATVLTPDYMGSAYNSTNDLVVTDQGVIFFSDPAYGGPVDGRTTPLGFEGVFRIDAAGQVSLVSDALVRPNGVTVSPDGAWLYAADAGSRKIYRAPLDAQDTPGALVEFISGSNVDGFAVDCAGNIYGSAQGEGVVVWDSSGEKIGAVPMSSPSTNLAFGGADHKTLYITGYSTLLSLELPIPGMPY